MPDIFFTQTDAYPYCSSPARQSLSPPPSRLDSPTLCLRSGNPRYALVNFADCTSVQSSFSTPLSPKTSQNDLNMAESTFPFQQNCPLRLQKFSEPPCNLKIEHWCKASSLTDDSAFAATYNLNPASISDDIATRHNLLRQVDYLSHDWQEEHIWSSWRYIVSNARLREGPSRFENALWRIWAKSKYKLKTIPPENINWLKDSDYNSLYGPLQSLKSSRAAFVSEPAIALPKHKCFLIKRPILKKRSISEVVLQKLMPALPILKRVGEIHIKHGSASADQIRDCPMVGGAASDSITYKTRSKSVSRVAMDYLSPPRTLGSQSLDQGKRKLLRFDETVEQFRAVDLEDAERDWSAESGNDSSDEGLLIKFPLKKRAFLHKNTENNSHTGSKIIEELPSTTLKSRSPPSQKTLSRPHPPTNSLIDEEEDTDVQFSKYSEASDDWFTIHKGRAAKHGEKKPLEIAEDISIPFKDDRDDPTGAGPENELTKVLRKGKDIAQAIWKYSWLQILEPVLIQCQSTIWALLGVRTSTPSPHERGYEPCGGRLGHAEPGKD